MPYFAKCEQTANSAAMLVTEVISADQAFVDTQPGFWVQTSYNTRGNVHYAPSPPAEPDTPDGGVALRGNYAGIGYTYDIPNDVFYAPAPYSDWVLDTATWLWIPPVPYPTDGQNYMWDEATDSWVLIPNPPAP
jgi:hypothetical protein